MKQAGINGLTITRNPLIFGLLKMVGLVEKVGSGISRMKNAMKTHGLPEPEFHLTHFFFGNL